MCIYMFFVLVLLFPCVTTSSISCVRVLSHYCHYSPLTLNSQIFDHGKEAEAAPSTRGKSSNCFLLRIRGRWWPKAFFSTACSTTTNTSTSSTGFFLWRGRRFFRRRRPRREATFHSPCFCKRSLHSSPQILLFWIRIRIRHWLPTCSGQTQIQAQARGPAPAPAQGPSPAFLHAGEAGIQAPRRRNRAETREKESNRGSFSLLC